LENKFIAKLVNMFSMMLRDLIKEEMNKRNLSIRDFAKLVGVSHPTISAVLNGEEPSFDLCRKLAPVLHIPLESVLLSAGLLPPASPDTEYAEQILHLLRQLSPQEQEEILELLRFKAERQKTARKTKSREKPPAQAVLKGE